MNCLCISENEYRILKLNQNETSSWLNERLKYKSNGGILKNKTSVCL
jgi:hypothetical protein